MLSGCKPCIIPNHVIVCKQAYAAYVMVRLELNILPDCTEMETFLPFCPTFGRTLSSHLIQNVFRYELLICLRQPQTLLN